LADDPDLQADQDGADDPGGWQVSAPVSRPAARQDLAASPDLAASLGSAACRDSGAAADSGGRGSVELPAAAVVAVAGADVAVDLDARQAAWAAVVAADAAASADASSNRGAHTKDDPHNSAPNSRRC
jgi:hypothetical protein